ncbi:MAG: tetratricopeptide repeat protein [Saprospiraceae bacterium]
MTQWIRAISRMTTLALILVSACPLMLSAQESKLAAQYYRDGEYEKAGQLYKSLYENNKNTYYFEKHIECLLNLERFDECERALEKEIRSNSKNVELFVTYGTVLERQFKEKEALKQYELAIKKLTASVSDITKLANAFVRQTKYDYAIEVYEKGQELVGEKYSFAYNLGSLYQRMGDFPNMIERYLMSVQERPSRLSNVQRLLEGSLGAEDYPELQSQLYGFIQENPEDNVHFVELLIWTFIKKNDFTNALRQAKALDRRLDEDGGRLKEMAEIAANEKEYDAAINAYQYIIDSKGPGSALYLDAQKGALSCTRKMVTDTDSFTREDLMALESRYEIFLDEFGKNSSSAGIIAELADFEAFYLANYEKAISLLQEMIEFPDIEPQTKANAKLSLADLYLILGERWEATLLYSQVDKSFRDDPLGHEARYRNAKLSYYFGDFQWAQSQFEVLKASTSKLIANDALDLSVFIMDNLGLDTSSVSLELFARADLLAFRRQNEEALTTLDTLLSRFPEHSLQDDVLYSKARIYQEMGNSDLSIEMYQRIIDEFPEDIRADNSLFELAELFENQVEDKERASELYERLFLEYSGSTFAVEARKRYRLLRGDTL